MFLVRIFVGACVICDKKSCSLYDLVEEVGEERNRKGSSLDFGSLYE